MLNNLSSVSRNKSSVFLLVFALIVGGVGAQASGRLNSPSGGYLVCVNSKTKVVTHPGTSACPKGSKKLVLGAQGVPGKDGITGAAGLSGKDGITGAAGLSGKDGKTLWNGVTDPESTWGAPGDMFINSLTKTLFGPKDLTTGWPAGVSLVGPQGPQGPGGSSGGSGPAGAIGATGPAGAIGATGPAGAIGATGPAGSNTTLTCALGGTCALGDTGPGGGIVFYVSTTPNTAATPWRYMEAAPNTWSEGVEDPVMPWCASSSGLVETNFLPIFGTSIDPVSGSAATSTAIGSGFRNTRLMLENCTFGPANAIALYNGGGKNDWFLPSKDELNQLRSVKTIVGGFEPNLYWSSSEFAAGKAWYQFMSLGLQTDTDKVLNRWVRPVRAF